MKCLLAQTNKARHLNLWPNCKPCWGHHKLSLIWDCIIGLKVTVAFPDRAKRVFQWRNKLLSLRTSLLSIVELAWVLSIIMGITRPVSHVKHHSYPDLKNFGIQGPMIRNPLKNKLNATHGVALIKLWGVLFFKSYSHLNHFCAF